MYISMCGHTSSRAPLSPRSRAPPEHDRHSIIADPLFVSPQQNDFHLQPGLTRFQNRFPAN